MATDTKVTWHTARVGAKVTLAPETGFPEGTVGTIIGLGPTYAKVQVPDRLKPRGYVWTQVKYKDLRGV